MNSFVHILAPERIELLLKGISSGDDMEAMQSCYELNDFLSLNTEESLGTTFQVYSCFESFPQLTR